MKTNVPKGLILALIVVSLSVYNVWKSSQIAAPANDEVLDVPTFQTSWGKTQHDDDKTEVNSANTNSVQQETTMTSSQAENVANVLVLKENNNVTGNNTNRTDEEERTIGSVFLDLRNASKHISSGNASSLEVIRDPVPHYAKAWSNMSTFAFYGARLRSGYRNQMMAFTILILECLRSGHGQFLMESVRQKDTYGTNDYINFWDLWDVEYWNSFYPQLPRLVRFDPILHDQFDPETYKWYRTKEGNWTDRLGNFYLNPSRPIPYGKQHKLMSAYIKYGKGKGIYATEDGHRHTAEILMLQGAMRPHPDLHEIIENLLHSLDGTKNNDTIEYMTLHARVVRLMMIDSPCILNSSRSEYRWNLQFSLTPFVYLPI
jgi:hypothetical protein